MDRVSHGRGTGSPSRRRRAAACRSATRDRRLHMRGRSSRCRRAWRRRLPATLRHASRRKRPRARGSVGAERLEEGDLRLDRDHVGRDRIDEAAAETRARVRRLRATEMGVTLGARRGEDPAADRARPRAASASARPPRPGGRRSSSSRRRPLRLRVGAACGPPKTAKARPTRPSSEFRLEEAIGT